MITLPPLHPDATWSVQVLDVPSGRSLGESGADVQCETASIGKVFLLVEVARRLEDGTLSDTTPVEIPAEHVVADSGLLYRMRDKRIGVYDAALLVGAFSDNLATNALLHLCGLDAVRDIAPGLGLRDTSLLDYIREERGPGMPWTPSYGTAAELAGFMRSLALGQVVSAGVSRQVLEWLSADADTSLVAGALLVDPLAHTGPEYQGISLSHKTGAVSFARADVGVVAGPEASVAYAVLANWKGHPRDLRAQVTDAMHAIGEGIRTHVTGRPRDNP